jgi:hypothetical protein
VNALTGAGDVFMLNLYPETPSSTFLARTQRKVPRDQRAQASARVALSCGPAAVHRLETVRFKMAIDGTTIPRSELTAQRRSIPHSRDSRASEALSPQENCLTASRHPAETRVVHRRGCSRSSE